VFERLKHRFERALQGDLVRRMLQNSSWMVGGQIASAALGLVQVAILSRALGKDLYGALVLISTAVITVRQLLSVRVWEWTTRDFTYAFEHRDRARAAFVIKSGLWTGALVNALSLALLTATAPLIARLLLKGQAPTELLVVFGATLLGSFGHDTCFAALRAAGLFRYLSLQGIAIAALRVLVLGATALATRALAAVVWAYVAIELASGAWLLLKMSRVFTGAFATPFWRIPTPGFIAALRRNKRLLFFGSLLDTLKLATARVDVLVLGYLATPASVAVYQAAYSFVDGLNRVTSPVSLVTFSELSRAAAHGDGGGLLRMVRRLRLAGLAGGAALCLGLFAAAPWLLRLVYGREFGDATPVLQALSVTLIWFGTLWMQPAFAAVGKSHWGLEVAAGSIAVKLVLLGLLAPSYAAFGVAVANAIYHLIPLAVSPWYLARLKSLVMAPSFKMHSAAWGSTT
jgi:O-antigen/teichoic acid export membrane protein